MRSSVLTLLSLVPSLSLAQVIINPTGGTSSSDGIRTTVGNTGQIQVLRNGTGQLYPQTKTAESTTNNSLTNGVFLAVGSTVTGPQNFATAASAGVTLQEWTPISNTLTPQGRSGTATTVLRATVGLRNYDLTITYQYTFPNDFVIVTHSLSVPTGNTATVRLYHVADAFLGGDDYGPSFFSLGPPALVGGYRPASNIVEAWRYRSGITWTGYFAGYYACLFNEARCPAGQVNSVNAASTFTNYIEPTTVDNSFGIMWNFGSAPGTYTAQNDLTFYSYQPQLSKRFLTTAIPVGNSTALTFTIDNVPGALPQSNLSFTDAFPTGLQIADAIVTNTCGGSVTTASGGAIAAGATSVRLSSGGFASTVSRCTLTVNVTSLTAGAYVNGMNNISALSVLENRVTDQTLSVFMGKPVVTLDPPGSINSGNATTYRVSGTCQDINGVVTVMVGTTVTSTTPCSGNLFSTTLSVAGLGDGIIQVSASQTNGSGTSTASASTSKDTSAPGLPQFTAPAAGSTSNDNTPTIAGTGEPGSTVRVLAGTTEVCAVVVPASGNWSCTSAQLPDGAFTLTARATDTAGNTGGTSPGRTATIDTMAPAPPTVTNPAANAMVAPNPSLSGTSEPAAMVLVFESTTLLCTSTAGATGQWSCPTTLGIGSHSITARATDTAGNSSGSSPIRIFTVADVPSVRLDTPAPINAANVTAVTVSGSCTTSAGLVTARLGSVLNLTTCTAGRFSTSLNASSVADGPAIVMAASQTNVSGTGTDTRSTLKDTIAPATPTIASPAENSFGNTTTPTFSGTGEPGSTVRVSRGPTELCTTVVPPSGQWACTASDLLPGPVVVTARATDAADNASGLSPQRTFTIDNQAPREPVISSPSMGASVAPNPTLTGTAEPYATITVFEGTILVCSVTADAAGIWSCNTMLGSGPHSLVAVQTDRAMNASPASSQRTFTVEGLPNVLLNVPADITVSNASAFVVTGACTANGGPVTVSVGLITTMVPCASGMFSATVDVRAVSDGAAIMVSASQTTAAGRASDSRMVRKDATAPSGTAVSQPMTGALMNTNTPPITGTAEPGSTVTVFINGNPVGTTVTDANGQWTFTPTTPIADGTYLVTASARDLIGNEGPQSTGPTFTIDGKAPIAPFIVTPAGNARVETDRILEISGFAEAGSTVTVYIDGQVVGTTIADSSGHFSIRLDPTTLSQADHLAEAEARDGAGNLSPKSDGVHFTIHVVDDRFAGQGLVGCSAAGGLSWGVLALLWLCRRREVRS